MCFVCGKQKQIGDGISNNSAQDWQKDKEVGEGKKMSEIIYSDAFEPIGKIEREGNLYWAKYDYQTPIKSNLCRSKEGAENFIHYQHLWMSGKKATSKETCQHKKAYHSRKEALLHKNLEKKHRRVKKEVYKCNQCSEYHLTKVKDE